MHNHQTFAQSIQKKIVPPDQLEAFGTGIRKQNKTLVTTNGSFDLLHPGHLDLLYEASLQAHVFLVLLNTDASIQAYKGAGRPINPLEVRIQHIAALKCVDYVSYFEETNPIRALSSVKPDIHTNGSDYGKNCIEAETIASHGGKIHIVKLVDGFSTTQLIEKIKSACD